MDGSGVMKTVKRPSSRPKPGIISASMKLAGRTMVAAIGRLRIWASIRSLLEDIARPRRLHNLDQG